MRPRSKAKKTDREQATLAARRGLRQPELGGQSVEFPAVSKKMWRSQEMKTEATAAVLWGAVKALFPPVWSQRIRASASD